MNNPTPPGMGEGLLQAKGTSKKVVLVAVIALLPSSWGGALLPKNGGGEGGYPTKFLYWETLP